MAYIPQNLMVFTAAFSGAIAGMGASDRNPSDPNPADYDGLATVAGAFAQSFDTEWALSPTSELDLETIQEITEVVWQDRAPQATAPVLNPDNFTWSTNVASAQTNPNTYTDLCRALIAIVRSGEAYFTSQGIIPPGPPATLSNANPADVGTVAVPGTGSTASRTDHVHKLPFSTVQSVLGAATGPIGVNAQKITNVGVPAVATDAARLGDIPPPTPPTPPAAPNKSLQYNDAGAFGALEGFTREAIGRLNTLLTSFISYGDVADAYPAINSLIKLSELPAAAYKTLISAFTNVPLFVTQLVGVLKELYIGGDPTDTSKTVDDLFLLGQTLRFQNAGQFRFNLDNLALNQNGLLQGDFIGSANTAGDAAFHTIWDSTTLNIPISPDCSLNVFMLIEAYQQPGHAKAATWVAMATFRITAGVWSQVGTIKILGENKDDATWDLDCVSAGAGGQVLVRGKSNADTAIWSGLIITQSVTGF